METKTAKSLGEVIKKHRQGKNMSQEVLSGLANVDRSHLSKIELGIRSPTMNVFVKIADALGVKASMLLSEIEEDANEA